MNSSAQSHFPILVNPVKISAFPFSLIGALNNLAIQYTLDLRVIKNFKKLPN